MRAHYLLCWIVCAACSGPQKGSKGPSCETIPPKLTEATVAEQEAHGATAEMLTEARANAKAIEPQLAKACVDDRWEAELVKCIDTAPPIQLGANCLSTMSATQLDTIQRLRAGGTTSSSPPEPPP
jgi:hypothetical protein